MRWARERSSRRRKRSGHGIIVTAIGRGGIGPGAIGKLTRRPKQLFAWSVRRFGCVCLDEENIVVAMESCREAVPETDTAASFNMTLPAQAELHQLSHVS